MTPNILRMRPLLPGLVWHSDVSNKFHIRFSPIPFPKSCHEKQLQITRFWSFTVFTQYVSLPSSEVLPRKAGLWEFRCFSIFLHKFLPRTLISLTITIEYDYWHTDTQICIQWFLAFFSLIMYGFIVWSRSSFLEYGIKFFHE